MTDGHQQHATQHVLLTASTQFKVAGMAAVLTVTRPEELAPALAQRNRPVVIANEQLVRKFSTLENWERAARWWFIPMLVCWFLHSALTREYKLEAEWHLKWKIERTFEGK